MTKLQNTPMLVAPGSALRMLATLLVASAPFDIYPLAGGRSLSGPIAVALILVWLVTGRLRTVRIDIPYLLLYFYTAWVVATNFWSVSQAQSMLASQNILLQFVLIFVMTDMWPFILTHALRAWTGGTALLSFIILQQPADKLRGGRATLYGIDENVTALVLTCGLGVALHLFFAARGKWGAAVHLAFALVIAAGALHTGSRTGALAVGALVATSLVIHLARQEGKRPWLRATGSILLISIGLKYSLDHGLLPERIVEFLQRTQNSTQDNRSEIIAHYLRHIDDWYLFGVGYGVDGVYLGDVEPGFAYNAHSLFWKTWIETGIVGLFFLFSFLFSALRKFSLSPSPRTVLLLGVPLVCFAVSLGGAQTSVFWLTLALALSRRPQPSPEEAPTAYLAGKSTLLSQ